MKTQRWGIKTVCLRAGLDVSARLRQMQVDFDSAGTDCRKTAFSVGAAISCNLLQCDQKPTTLTPLGHLTNFITNRLLPVCN